MKDILFPLMRHGLTSAGGYLAAKGVIAASTVDEAVGAVIVLVGVLWSIFEKSLSKKKE
jgi:hypothetical protein